MTDQATLTGLNGAILTDVEIGALVDALPGGATGYLKTWGYLNLARAVEEAVQDRMPERARLVAMRSALLDMALTMAVDLEAKIDAMTALLEANAALPTAAEPVPAALSVDRVALVEECKRLHDHAIVSACAAERNGDPITHVSMVLTPQLFATLDRLAVVPERLPESDSVSVHQALRPGNLHAAEAGSPLPAGMVTADFPIIAMGHGKVEVGDGIWEGLPVLWFGNEGQSLGFERQRGHELPVKDRESLVMFTFANIQGLEAIEAAVARLRKTLTSKEEPACGGMPAAEA